MSSAPALTKGRAPHAQLDEHERGQAAEHSAPRALVIHEVLREQGEEELRRPTAALAWSGLAAGMSLGFSFLPDSSAFRASFPKR
jgi:hypothetical protein